MNQGSMFNVCMMPSAYEAMACDEVLWVAKERKIASSRSLLLPPCYSCVGVSNAAAQPRLEAEPQRTLEGVSCSWWFGLVMALCRTLKDRHDLHQTTLGI